MPRPARPSFGYFALILKPDAAALAAPGPILALPSGAAFAATALDGEVETGFSIPGTTGMARLDAGGGLESHRPVGGGGLAVIPPEGVPLRVDSLQG